MSIVYNYSYSSADVPNTKVTVFRTSLTDYVLIFVQEAVTEDLFKTVSSRYPMVVKSLRNFSDGFLPKRKIIANAKVYDNPPPETIFRFVDDEDE